jgi:hypothetical protein
MITVPTAIVLGAGASHHCNYPLGRGLLSELVGLRRSRDLEQFLDEKNWLGGRPEGLSSQRADEFLGKMSGSDHGSVDAFLERHPEYVDLGKLLIAKVLKTREQLDHLFPPIGKAGWYRILFDRLLSNNGRRFDPGAHHHVQL